MTREELRDYVDEQRTLNNIPYYVYSKLIDGIDTLEQEPTAKNDLGVDCISREDALMCLTGMFENREYEPSELIKIFARRIKTLPSVTPQEPKWIPVSKRLPKAGEYEGNTAKYYLVQNEYGDMLVARYTHSEYWEQMYQLKPISDEVVAWRELPEPYKAESEIKE